MKHATSETSVEMTLPSVNHLNLNVFARKDTLTGTESVVSSTVIQLFKKFVEQYYIVAHHPYKGSCVRWFEDMWRAYVKVVFPQCKSLTMLNRFHYTITHDILQNYS